MMNSKFKYTEVGMIPSDWEVKRIGDICQIFGRIGFRGYTVNDIVKSTEGAVTISPSNIQDGKMNFTKCTYISWFKYEESPEIKIFNGDILLVKTGSTFGKTSIVNGLKEKATVNPQIVVLKKVTIDNFFLGYVMGYEVVQNQIKTSIVGGAIPTLSQKQVASFLIPLPPTKAEQTAIATALNDADALIQKLEQLISKKRHLKTGAMQELLRPKEGWEEKKLGEVLVNISSGKSNTQSQKGPYPIYGSTGIIGWNNCFDYEGEKILIARVGANAGTLNMVSGKYLVSDNTLILSFSKMFDIRFLYFVLINFNLNSLVFGSGQPLITGGQLKNLYVTFPKSKSEQTRIAQILSDMDHEIQALEKQLEQYKMLKQGMMQSLLTGKIRLV